MASAVRRALISNDTPLTIAPRLNIPKAAAPVAPIVCLVKNTIELVVIAVVATVAVPPVRVTVPNEFAPAAVVVPTLVLNILFPAVPRTKLPLVAVIAPSVAVREVVVVKDPGAVIADGREKVREFVPPVVVIWAAVPAIVTFPAPSGTTGSVPASGVKESIATPPPVRSIVRVDPVADVVTPVPPTMAIAPAVGRAEPVSAVNVSKSPEPALSKFHTAEIIPLDAVMAFRIYVAGVSLSTQI